MFGSALRFQQDFNRFNFGLLGTFHDRRDYDEEDADQDEDERDRNRYGARLRTGYFISPRINAFLQGGYRREQRDASNKTQRDNNVYSAGVGTAIDFTGLLFGETFVGWSLQEFDESTFDSENGLDYGVNLTWNPTRLTTLRLDGGGGLRRATSVRRAWRAKSDCGSITSFGATCSSVAKSPTPATTSRTPIAPTTASTSVRTSRI